MLSLWRPPKIVGKVKVKIWHLEMFKPPPGPPVQPPDGGVEIVRCSAPTANFYRFLYGAVGDQWLWSQRRLLSDDQLLAAITAPTIDLRILWRQGCPAGYCEIDFRDPDDTELLYFGLMPDALGCGQGSYFIDWTVRHAFAGGARRLWVHTCDLDHPRARATYEAAGFEAFDSETGEEVLLEGMALPEHARDRAIEAPD